MKKHALQLLLSATVLTVFMACNNTQPVQSKHNISLYNFPNVLDIKNTPSQAIDWNSFCFFDKGAWFGFALPQENSQDYYGSFAGPFMATEGKWFGEYIAKLNLTNENTNQEFILSDSSNTNINYYPGLLVQEYELKNIKVKLKLSYSSESNAIINVAITNKSNASLNISPTWTGKVFPDAATLHKNNKQIIAKSIADTTSIFVNSLNKVKSITSNKTNYKLTLNSIKIEPQEVQQINLSVSIHQSYSPKNIDSIFTANESRWNTYVSKVLETENSWGNKREYQNIAIKSLETLVNNWKSAYGHIYHEGLFPSYAVNYFNGFWAWDSWKHAVAVVEFEPEVAKNQIRTMFDYQNSAGMVADCIYADSTENNWLNTKPPLASWAVWNVFEQTNDTAFLQEMLPKLVKYHYWWYTNRDYNKNLLCEYGSSDQRLVAAKWESGMDNAIRFDHSKMIKIDDGNWAFNQESVDLNAYLYEEKLFLAKAYATIGKQKQSDELVNDANKLRLLINNTMYHSQTGYYYDYNTEKNTIVDVLGPEGWTPLFTKLASKSQAEGVIKIMLDTTKFASYIPFPTASLSEPEFSEGYWRGPIWLDQTYFAIQSLVNYGYTTEAETFTLQVFDRLEGLKEQAPIRENYWPINGKGMRVNHFSWSAAHLLMLYKNDYKTANN